MRYEHSRRWLHQLPPDLTGAISPAGRFRRAPSPSTSLPKRTGRAPSVSASHLPAAPLLQKPVLRVLSISARRSRDSHHGRVSHQPRGGPGSRSCDQRGMASMRTADGRFARCSTPPSAPSCRQTGTNNHSALAPDGAASNEASRRKRAGRYLSWDSDRMWITTGASVRGPAFSSFRRPSPTSKDRRWRSSCPAQTNSPRNNYGRQPRYAL